MFDHAKLLKLAALAGLAPYEGESVEDFALRVSVAAHRSPVLVTLCDYALRAEEVAGRWASAEARDLAERRIGIDVYVPWIRRATVRQRERIEGAVIEALSTESPVTLMISPVRVRRRRRRAEDGRGGVERGTARRRQADPDRTGAAGDA